MSNDIRLTVKSSKATSRSGHREYCFPMLNCMAAALVLLVFAGCKGRKVVTPTPQMEVDEQFWVRVLLDDDIQECEIKIDSNYSLEETNTYQQDEQKVTQFQAPDEPVIIQYFEGQIYIANQGYQNDQIVIIPENPYIFSLNDKSYRGKVELIVNSDSDSFDVINLVPLESYIAGVAGAEMPDYWEPEALKCQVIAARTYCLYIKKRFGSSRTWDVRKTAANQVYLGTEAESSAVWSAVNETAGMVLTCLQDDGTEDIFPAYYSSTCGGHTENSDNVFGDSYEPLSGVVCDYCKDVAKPEIFFWPEFEVDKTEAMIKLINKYPNLIRLGENLDITVAEQIDYNEFSRITKIDISGPNDKSDFLRAEDFRLTIDPTGRKFKSATCELEITEDTLVFKEGRGWGHSVGMCQCGAEGMAREGKTTEEILMHYYPGSKIVEIEYK